MTQALAEPDSISKLIVVDISPAKGAISPEFANYIVGMREVDQANVNSKKEGDKILQSYEEVCYLDSASISVLILTILYRVCQYANSCLQI